MASGQGNNRRLFGQRGLAALKWGDRGVKGCTGSSPAHARCLTAFFPPPFIRANLGNKEHPALRATEAPPAPWVPPV